MVAANVGRVSDIPGRRPSGRKMNIFTDGLQGRGLMQSLRRCLPAIRYRAFDKYEVQQSTPWSWIAARRSSLTAHRLGKKRRHRKGLGCHDGAISQTSMAWGGRGAGASGGGRWRRTCAEPAGQSGPCHPDMDRHQRRDQKFGSRTRGTSIAPSLSPTPVLIYPRHAPTSPDVLSPPPPPAPLPP